MKTGKPSALVIGRRLRRTLGALLAIGFATTWWKFVPTRESVAAPIEKPPAVAESTRLPVVVIPIPIVLPFTLPTAPTPPTPPTPKPVQVRHRPRIVHPPQVAVVDPPVHQPFALPPPVEVPPPPELPPEVPEVPPPTTDEMPHIRTRSS